MKNLIESVLVNKILEDFNDNSYKFFKCTYKITRSVSNKYQVGSLSFNFELYKKDGSIEEDYYKPLWKGNELNGQIKLTYESLIRDEIKRFNKMEVKIFPNGTFKQSFLWDSQEDYDNNLLKEKEFYNFINDFFVKSIFEYEEDNNLLSTIIDDDNELQYIDSWDKGFFSIFIEDESNVIIDVCLFSNGVKRVFDTNCLNEFKTNLLEHYFKTHNEFKKDWEPWNMIKIVSHNGKIPKDKVSERVKYYLKASK